MKIKSSYFSLISAFSLGIVLASIVSWVAPFSESVSFDIAYILIAFCFGVLLRYLLKVKTTPVITLFFIGITIILLLQGQPILYKMAGNYYWGWSIAYLFCLTLGLLYNSEINIKSILIVVAGGILGFLFYEKPSLVYFTIALIMIHLWGSYFALSQKIILSFIAIIVVIISFDSKIPLSARQKKFSDLIIYSDFTRENKIDVTTWRGNYWYYINNQNRLSSVDDYLYHEPLVHPVLSINQKAKKVLVLGGEFGGAIKEICKYRNIEEVVLIPDDFDLIQKVKNNQLFNTLSGKSWNDSRLRIKNVEIFDYLSDSPEQFDVIIADLPDPNSLLHNQYYSKEFFELCYTKLAEGGVFVTQAGSPYFATKAFYSIIKTMKYSGFKTIPYHNQILTLGEWGWVLGSKEKINKQDILSVNFSDKPVRWINQDAMRMMLSFGKITVDTTDTKVNTIKEPITYKYYVVGNWSF